MKNLLFGMLSGLVLFVCSGWRGDDTKFRALLGGEDAVFIRGEGALADGKLSVTLPLWFPDVCTDQGSTIQLTCKSGWSPLYASPVANGAFVVQTASGGVMTQAFWWEVKARKTAR